YYFTRNRIKAPKADLTIVPPPAVEAAVPAPVEVPAPVKPPTINSALRSTRESFWGKIQRSVIGAGEIEGQQLETIEEILYTSDLGPTTVTRLLDSVEEQLSRKEKRSLDVLKDSL